MFADSCGFDDYVNYALDVPMYFIVRDGTWIDMTDYSFRRFWEQGHDAHRATLDDWNAHLTTLFPEFRLKGYIEVRSMDSQAPEHMLAAPALIKGIFYEADCLLGAWDLVKRWSWSERLEILHEVQRQALHARIRRIEVRELARELIDIAVAGLEREPHDEDGETEAIYLQRVQEMVRHGTCPAELLIDKWNGVWDREVVRLVEGSSYRIAA